MIALFLSLSFSFLFAFVEQTTNARQYKIGIINKHNSRARALYLSLNDLNCLRLASNQTEKKEHNQHQQQQQHDNVQVQEKASVDSEQANKLKMPCAWIKSVHAGKKKHFCAKKQRIINYCFQFVALISVHTAMCTTLIFNKAPKRSVTVEFRN